MSVCRQISRAEHPRLIPSSASRLSTVLHATRHRHAEELHTSLLASHEDTEEDVPPPSAGAALTDVQSAVTLFLISWPVQAVFVGFVWMSGWIEMGGMLTCVAMVVYGVTVGS